MEDRRLHRIGCVVTDELHLLGDPRRGYLLEVLLTKLLYMNRLADRSANRTRSNLYMNRHTDRRGSRQVQSPSRCSKSAML